MIGPIAFSGAQTECRAYPGTQPGAQEHADADQHDEEKGTQPSAPKVTCLGDGVGEIVFLCVVFDVAVEGNAHDGGAYQHEEDAGG